MRHHHNLLFSALFTIIRFEEHHSLQCICDSYNGGGCHDVCEGSYCQSTWIVANGAVADQGCVTTRSDLSSHKCHTNRKGLVSCDSDQCNDASFSIPSDAELTVPPVVKCFTDGTLSEDNFCFGHMCKYKTFFTINDFGDFIPGKEEYRECSDDVYNHDLGSSNMCYLMGNTLTCKCTTEFCNRRPFQPVPIGTIRCYRVDSRPQYRPWPSKYCLGHICYVMKDNYFDVRGCISFSDGAPEEVMRAGENEALKFCNEPLCNGDFFDGSGMEESKNETETSNGTSTV